MKRYLLFRGEQYYPLGGWDDFKGDFDTIGEALEKASNEWGEWWHIVDTKSDKLKVAIVERDE